MYETDVRSRLGHGFEAQTLQRAEVTTEGIQGNAEGGEIGCVQRAFETTSADGDDAAKDRSPPEEREEIGDEANTGVVV